MIEFLYFGQAELKRVFDGILRILINVRQKLLLEGVEAKLISVVLLHGNQFLAILGLVLNGLTRNKIQIAAPTLALDIKFNDMSAPLFVIGQRVLSKQLLKFKQVWRVRGECETLAVETEQLDKASAPVFGALVEAERHDHYVAVFYGVVLVGQDAQFGLAHEHHFVAEILQPLQLFQVQHH